MGMRVSGRYSKSLPPPPLRSSPRRRRMSQTEVQRALTQLNELTASGDTRRAAALLSAAQRAAPANPDFAVRQLEVCLQANQLVCAAHSARALLRHAPAEHPEICRMLASARAFGARAAGLRWCPPAEPCTRSVANASVDGGVVAATGASLDDGQMWRAENFISTLKMMLADDSLWRGRTGRTLLNHAVMQQMQARAIASAAAWHSRDTLSAATLRVLRAMPRSLPTCTTALSSYCRALRTAMPISRCSSAALAAVQDSRERLRSSRKGPTAVRGGRSWAASIGCRASPNSHATPSAAR